MLSRKDLEFAIKDLEKGEPTYQACAKLADLYIILDHLKPVSYSEKLSGGKSEFLRTVGGKDAEAVMKVMDELMETTLVLYPKLYENVLMRINELCAEN